MTTVEVFAPAKINLTLHITGRRDDGYHEIDSLVAFMPVSDRLVMSSGHPLSLTIGGPEALGVPADMNNLALRAAGIFEPDWDVSIVLEKFLPVASGIGGGSADAAAVLRGSLVLLEDWTEENLRMPDDEFKRYADRILALGADVPMCLFSKTCRARGVGERIEIIKLPSLSAVLVNPRVPVSTADVFELLEMRVNDAMPEDLPDFLNASSLTDWLALQRNDLELPALEIAPQIGDCLEALRSTVGCQLARMSGSGATCFGIFRDDQSAIAASELICGAHPDWWVKAGELCDCSGIAFPKIN